MGEGGSPSSSATNKPYDLVLDGSNMPIGIHRGDGGEIKVRNRVVYDDDQGNKKAKPVPGQVSEQICGKSLKHAYHSSNNMDADKVRACRLSSVPEGANELDLIFRAV